ncbi:hypothetical protein TDB9533_03732 [Thalassocella blandensis]|nr:hypothetical protein TDB9533_03732 [Thalassocella blandensis]
MQWFMKKQIHYEQMLRITNKSSEAEKHKNMSC